MVETIIWHIYDCSFLDRMPAILNTKVYTERKRRKQIAVFIDIIFYLFIWLRRFPQHLMPSQSQSRRNTWHLWAFILLLLAVFFFVFSFQLFHFACDVHFVSIVLFWSFQWFHLFHFVLLITIISLCLLCSFYIFHLFHFGYFISLFQVFGTCQS